MAEKELDFIIVGGGPAGLTAGIYAARSGLNTLILEEKFAGGMLAEAPFVENYPGFQEGLSGLELANRMEVQAKSFGVRINSPEKVVSLELKRKVKAVQTDRDVYSAGVVLLALGCEHRQLSIPGEKEFLGRGVSFCATCDGPFFRKKRVMVVGGGNSAATTAIHLSTLASSVKIVHRRDALRADHVLVNELKKRGVDIILNASPKEIQGDTLVRRVVLEDAKSGERRHVEVDGIFVQVGVRPHSEVAKDAGVTTDGEGFIVVDERQRTNIRGVYAAGDVTNRPIKQVGTAVGQAIVAAVEALEYTRNLTTIDDLWL